MDKTESCGFSYTNCWEHDSDSNRGRARIHWRWCLLSFLTVLLLATSLVLILFWVFYYYDGVALYGSHGARMNLHYVLMIAGFVFFNGHSMLAYRLFSCCKKLYAKIIHTVLFLGSASCISIGLYAVIDVHDHGPGSVHFYTLHSWIGLVACGLFVLQFMSGFFSFFVLLCCDTSTVKFRQVIVPFHVTFGLIIFTISTVAILTGLMETAKYTFSGKNGAPSYRDYPAQAMVVNSLAMVLIALCIALPLLIRHGGSCRQ